VEGRGGLKGWVCRLSSGDVSAFSERILQLSLCTCLRLTSRVAVGNLSRRLITVHRSSLISLSLSLPLTHTHSLSAPGWVHASRMVRRANTAPLHVRWLAAAATEGAKATAASPVIVSPRPLLSVLDFFPPVDPVRVRGSPFYTGLVEP
jgi:hypothetical protein